MLPVISDADSVPRIYQMLLAFCTTWQTIGFERGFILLADAHNNCLSGYLAAEKQPIGDHPETDIDSPASFEAMAKSVFDNYEQIDSSDLTVKTRSYTVALNQHSSAAVKAANSGYPVLAEGRMSEFEDDDFFELFGTNCYVALPLRVDERVLGVLCADNAASGAEVRVDDVSLVYGLAQQAALAVERQMGSSDNRRKFRVLHRVQEVLRAAESESALGEAVNLCLSMVCRAAGGTGVFLKDMVRNRTVHIKAVDELTVEADETDVTIAESFDGVLDRAMGSMRPVRGDGQHALLADAAADSIRFFHACPLISVGEGLGAIAVYAEKHAGNRKQDRFDINTRTFIELAAGALADRLDALHKSSRIARIESLLEELRSNLVRERDSARVGSRALDHYRALTQELGDLRDVVFSRLPYEKRVHRAKGLLDAIEKAHQEFESELEKVRSDLRLLDLAELVGDVARTWSPRLEAKGAQVTLRIPKKGPSLLMNGANIRMALSNIIATMSDGLAEGDKVLLECSTSDDKAVVMVADTGRGLPGNLLSRLFMPFSDPGSEEKNAMSLAGDILQQHAGEISLRSSPSWKTILVIMFPLSANRDRRRTRNDRRRRRDRRERQKVG